MVSCPHRVLIVEDNEDTRALYGLVMRTLGWDVVEACDGVEGLEALQRDRACVILLDLDMPRMDGFGFRDAQRADPAVADVPVILVTGSSRASSANERIGAARVFVKPCSPYAVRQAVNSICSDPAHALASEAAARIAAPALGSA